MKESFPSPDTTEKDNERIDFTNERIDRVHEKHDRFMQLTFRVFQEYLTKSYKDFDSLSSADKNRITNAFLLQEYPESQSDFRTKLKVELLKML